MNCASFKDCQTDFPEREKRLLVGSHGKRKHDLESDLEILPPFLFDPDLVDRGIEVIHAG